MSAKLTNIGSNLSKIDAHNITDEEYEEIPELTDDFFEHANHCLDGNLVRRGRPKSEQRKLAITVRYDADVINAYFDNAAFMDCCISLLWLKGISLICGLRVANTRKTSSAKPCPIILTP
ncbi:MAG: hypothetical protein EBR59_10520 [Methylococcaceae bacterium]|nr:hypothetical protein [Methylococcaceae bacterium]